MGLRERWARIPPKRREKAGEGVFFLIASVFAFFGHEHTSVWVAGSVVIAAIGVAFLVQAVQAGREPEAPGADRAPGPRPRG